MTVSADIDPDLVEPGEIIEEISEEYIPGLLSRNPGVNYSLEGASLEEIELLRNITIASIAERIAEGTFHASITIVKPVSISVSLLSSLSVLVTFIVLGLSSSDTLEGSFGAESPLPLLVVTSLFLEHLDSA